jgi:predicted esterase YcpF (UPF0227 family)
MKASMPTTHLLYLHGFRSSPQSAKATLMARYMAEHHPSVVWLCPQLPPSPREAMEMVAAATADWPSGSMAVVGSSLGGFYATWVAEQRGCKAALINPAVYPARDLEKYIGSQTQWHQPEEAFYFQAHYVDELRELVTTGLHTPEDYFAIIAKGDEVLDWREMQARYATAKLVLLEGGNHAISDFDVHLPAAMAHLNCA